MKEHLSPADLDRLAVPVEAARNEATADAWLQQESTKPGLPLTERAVADPTLSSDQKAIAIIKVLAEESAQESSRVATVMELDDRLASARRALAITPGSHEIGIFAKLADSYAHAGASQQAAEAQRLALQEPFLQAFAQASPDRQQKLIDSLPAANRLAAEAIQREQSDAFHRNALSQSDALRADVGLSGAIEGVDDGIDTGSVIGSSFHPNQRIQKKIETYSTKRRPSTTTKSRESPPKMRKLRGSKILIQGPECGVRFESMSQEGRTIWLPISFFEEVGPRS